MASISISGWGVGRYYTLTVTESSYNSINNTSVVSWTLSASGDSGTWYDYYLYASVNGTVVYNGSGSWSAGTFPAATGSKSGTMTISHGTDGKKTISFYIEGYAYQYSTKSNSGSLTLTNIDRTAPTVTQADISNIDVTSFTISATSNVNCDRWDYSLNNGSTWVNFSTTNGQSASTTVTGLSMNTDYTVLIRARKTLNQVYGTSGSKTAKTLGSSTISSASDITLGNACGITWTPLDLDFRYKLTFSLGAWSYTTNYINPNQLTAYTYSGYTIPVTVAEQLPNATTGAMTVTLTTYNNGEAIGTPSSTTFTVTVPSNVVPTITSVTIEEGTHSGYNVYVKSLSTVKATVVASGVYNATITSIIVKVGDISYAASLYTGVATSDILQVYGSVTVLTTVTDSRGRTSTNTQTITVYDYFRPTVALSIDINGTTVATTVAGSIAPVNNLNAKSLVITRKRISDDTTTTYTVSPLTSYNYSVTWTQTVADIDTESYEYTAAVTDTKQTVTVKQLTAVICISRLRGGKGVTFFGEAQDEGIWIVNGGNRIELDYVVDQGTSGIWQYRKWNSGVAECWGRYTASVTTLSAWGSVYHSDTAFSVNYPVGLFNAMPTITAVGDATSGNYSVIGIELTATGTKDATAGMKIIRPNSSGTNVDYDINIMAKGTWK